MEQFSQEEKEKKIPIIFITYKLYFMGHSQQSQTNIAHPDCLWHSRVMTLSHYRKMFCLFAISSELGEFDVLQEDKQV